MSEYMDAFAHLSSLKEAYDIELNADKKPSKTREYVLKLKTHALAIALGLTSKLDTVNAEQAETLRTTIECIDHEATFSEASAIGLGIGTFVKVANIQHV
jgi:hypothetical protein